MNFHKADYQRLQVIFPKDDIIAIKKAAQRSRMTMSEWVRQVLREAMGRERPLKSTYQRIEAIRRGIEEIR